MRRADRLFELIRLLRQNGLVTAARLAAELEVSERTVYRDVADLVRSGVPIEGEAGLGYVLEKGYDLPPLMFDADQIEALVLGTRMVETWGDAALGRAARGALARIELVLSTQLRKRLETTALFVNDWREPAGVAEHLSALRHAIHDHEKVRLGYTRADGEVSQRDVRPLGLFFWGQRWMLTGWCELRSDFRNFRLDRIDEFAKTGERFREEPGRTLQDFIALFESHEE